MGVSASDSPIKKCYDCGNWLASVYRDPIDNAHFCERCYKLRLKEQEATEADWAWAIR